MILEIHKGEMISESLFWTGKAEIINQTFTVVQNDVKLYYAEFKDELSFEDEHNAIISIKEYCDFKEIKQIWYKQ